MSTQIRLAVSSDAGAVAAIYRPSITQSSTSFEIEPPNAAEMAARMAAVLERTPWLVLELAGVVAGYAYASKHRDRAAYQWSVEVSAYVDAACRGRGVGRALYASLFAILAAQGFRNAYAGVTLPNPASVGLHTAVGFTSIGVFRRIGYKAGRWHDVGWFEREIAPHTVDPPPPVPLPQLSSVVLAPALEAGLPLVKAGD
jgi:L-amino acid N-acyltransferase YncA